MIALEGGEMVVAVAVVSSWRLASDAEVDKVVNLVSLLSSAALSMMSVLFDSEGVGWFCTSVSMVLRLN